MSSDNQQQQQSKGTVATMYDALLAYNVSYPTLTFPLSPKSVEGLTASIAAATSRVTALGKEVLYGPALRDLFLQLESSVKSSAALQSIATTISTLSEQGAQLHFSTASVRDMFVRLQVYATDNAVAESVGRALRAIVANNPIGQEVFSTAAIRELLVKLQGYVAPTQQQGLEYIQGALSALSKVAVEGEGAVYRKAVGYATYARDTNAGQYVLQTATYYAERNAGTVEVVKQKVEAVKSSEVGQAVIGYVGPVVTKACGVTSALGSRISNKVKGLGGVAAIPVC